MTIETLQSMRLISPRPFLSDDGIFAYAKTPDHDLVVRVEARTLPPLAASPGIFESEGWRTICNLFRQTGNSTTMVSPETFQLDVITPDNPWLCGARFDPALFAAVRTVAGDDAASARIWVHRVTVHHYRRLGGPIQEDVIPMARIEWNGGTALVAAMQPKGREGLRPENEMRSTSVLSS